MIVYSANHSTKGMAMISGETLTTRVVLPWPASCLTPNAKRRAHWTAYSKAAKRARSDAFFETRLQISRTDIATLKEWDGRIAVKLHFYPPDKRRRDQDGMQATLKHALDGVADAIGIDDHLFSISPVFHMPIATGRVVIEISLA